VVSPELKQVLIDVGYVEEIKQKERQEIKEEVFSRLTTLFEQGRSNPEEILKEMAEVFELNGGK